MNNIHWFQYPGVVPVGLFYWENEQDTYCKSILYMHGCIYACAKLSNNIHSAPKLFSIQVRSTGFMYVINIFSLDMSAKKYAGSNKALRPHRHILNLLNHREEQACCI